MRQHFWGRTKLDQSAQSQRCGYQPALGFVSRLNLNCVNTMDKPSSGRLAAGVGSWAGVGWMVGAVGTVVATEPVSDVSRALVVGCVVAVGTGVEINIVAA